jgi:hypothetical protein
MILVEEMKNNSLFLLIEVILLIAIMIGFIFYGYNVGKKVNEINPCAIEEEFRPSDAPSEEECHAWQELERIRAEYRSADGPDEAFCRDLDELEEQQKRLKGRGSSNE